MIKTKKQMFITIGVFTLVLLLGSVSYAWFTYRAESGSSKLVAGDIYMHMTEGNETLTLTNIFPETKEEARARNDNYITFEISGLNTSNKTIYYDIVLNHGEDKASPKSRYADTDLKFDLVELDSNGDEVTYVVDEGSYDTLINKRIWADTIAASTTNEISKKYKLRAWLSDTVIISDTEPNANYNTTEYKNKYANIKVTINGDFTEKNVFPTLYEIISRNAVMDNINSTYVNNVTPGIDFGELSSDTNGKGVYTRAGTENDSYPIRYYRGAIDNNNIYFANYCWKAVRTTETGGVKLIYNGEKNTKSEYENNNVLSNTDINYTNDDEYPYSYDTTTQRWTSNNEYENSTTSTFTFTVKDASHYSIDYFVSSEGSYDMAYFYKNDDYIFEISGEKTGRLDLGDLNTTDEIKVEYTKDYDSYEGEDNISFNIIKNYGQLIQIESCDNKGEDSIIKDSTWTTFPFNNDDVIPTYSGYMYGAAYTKSSDNWTSGALFGTDFTWDGTNYKLVNATTSTPDATHHYSCNSTDANATCTDLRYVYYVGGIYKYYIVLKSGQSIENALTEMHKNTTDSNAKIKIDEWYEENMTGVTNKLEDTIWCNDRSIVDKGGFDPNGGALNTLLYYGAYQRSNNATNSSTVKNQPSLVCVNKIDRFTVNDTINGNGALTYPVALLTADEIVLAGGVSEKINTDFYLRSESQFFTLTPSKYYVHDVWMYVISYANYGELVDTSVDSYSSFRPAVSLKPGAVVISGSGTAENPYVIN